MLSNSITEDQLRIVIHHVGGIGGYGQPEALDNLGHVQWIIYDAQEESLSSTDKLQSGHFSFVNKCIGETNSRAEFHVTAAPSASSMLTPARSAANYTYMIPDGSTLVWGVHARVAKSVEMEVHAIDSMVHNNEVPPVDFLSIDAQGAELLILKGASEMLRERIAGIFCEVEFTELYEGQPLFSDIQSFFRKDRFRLCEIYNLMHLNTAPLSRELQGKGFLTVGEALFLREGDIWIGDESTASLPQPSIQNVVQTLKLAAIAVVFDQLDYALGLCRRLEEKKLVSLDRLANRSNVKYVKMLRDLCRAADGIQARTGQPPLYIEPMDGLRYPEAAKLMRKLSHLFALLGFIIPAAFQKLIREILKRKFVTSDSPIGAILYEYGLEELAAKHVMRSPQHDRLKHHYMMAWEQLFK